MEHHKKKEIKEINYYKISTCILGAIIIIGIIIYGINYYGNNQYEKGIIVGQTQAINTIVQTVATSGSVKFADIDLTLVPAQAINLAQEQTIMAIFEMVNKEGYVQLFNNNNTLVLVPYQQPTTTE